ncbi:MAG: hypothetical protein HYY44_00525, partial [Deltaproteobacteria bacterium]|nr:hypothetical protein [Deltaproteobacteria bacterium]
MPWFSPVDSRVLPLGFYSDEGRPDRISYRPGRSEYSVSTALLASNPSVRRSGEGGGILQTAGMPLLASVAMTLALRIATPAIGRLLAPRIKSPGTLFLSTNLTLLLLLMTSMTALQRATQGGTEQASLLRQLGTTGLYTAPSLLLGMGLLHRFRFGTTFLQDLILEPVQASITACIGLKLGGEEDWSRLFRRELLEGLPYFLCGRLTGSVIDLAGTRRRLGSVGDSPSHENKIGRIAARVGEENDGGLTEFNSLHSSQTPYALRETGLPLERLPRRRLAEYRDRHLAGLFRLQALAENGNARRIVTGNPVADFDRLCEISRGIDTLNGRWRLARERYFESQNPTKGRQDGDDLPGRLTRGEVSSEEMKRLPDLEKLRRHSLAAYRERLVSLERDVMRGIETGWI